MPITLSHSTLISEAYSSRSNGELTARGIVSLFNNPYSSENISVKINDISIRNQNSVAFFEHKELSVSSIRAICRGLTEIADQAEIAVNLMKTLEKSGKASTK